MTRPDPMSTALARYRRRCELWASARVGVGEDFDKYKHTVERAVASLLEDFERA